MKYFPNKKTATRPIRLPVREIKGLVRDFRRKLRSRGLPKPNRVVAEGWLTINNVKGVPVDVEIFVVGSSKLDLDKKDLIQGAYFKRSKSSLPGKLVIYVNSYLPPQSFENRPDHIVDGELYKILTHELTHVADIWSGKGSVGDLSKSLDDLKRYHHNHPAEVRSLMRDVVTDVEPAVRDYLEMGFSFNDSVKHALEDSKWVEVEPYMSQKNKKTLLKGVYTHLQDQGFDKMASSDLYQQCRNVLIKFAYDNPQYRKELLPMLKDSSQN